MYRRIAATFIASFVVCWTLGLMFFSYDALHTRVPFVKCDGIVVLTGGADRIEVAMDLLQRGFGRELLISGVAPHTTLAQLVPRQSLAEAQCDRKHITLGRRAVSTIGNAAETADWAHANQIRSLMVVTAGYHVRRAMTEIKRAAPGIRLYAFPVRSPVLRNPSALRTGRLLIIEYTKWLGSLLRLSRGINLKPAH